VDAAFLLRLSGMMNSHPSVRTYNAAEFQASTKAFVTPPASNSGFKQWSPFFIPATNTEIQSSLIDGSIQCSTNLVVVQFNTTTLVQTYDVSIATQTACRFSSNVLYSNLVQAPLHIDANMEHNIVSSLQVDPSRAYDESDLAAASGGPLWTPKTLRPTPYGPTVM